MQLEGSSYDVRTYVLRTLVNDIPLAPEGSSTKSRITCVELWGQWYLLASGTDHGMLATLRGRVY